MVKLSKQLEELFNEWQDNIGKEIDRIEIDNAANVDAILALKDKIRENEDELAMIEINVRDFAKKVLKIADNADNVRDYAAYVADTVDEIEEYIDKNEDEDEEPIAYCDNCGETIWDGEEIVYGKDGKYCCEECREEAEGENEEPAAYCDNCRTAIWNEDKIVHGYEGEYCCDECRKEVEDEEDEDNAPEV